MTRIEAERKAADCNRANTEKSKGVSFVAEHLRDGKWAVCRKHGSASRIIEQ